MRHEQHTDERCRICRLAVRLVDGKPWCADCERWANGELPRKAPGGYPPRSGLAFYARDSDGRSYDTSV
jgi:hypothetical protein